MINIDEIRLTEDEIQRAMWDGHGWYPTVSKADRAISNKATDKAIGMMTEYGDEPCKDENHAHGRYFYATHGYYCHKSNCQECRQALKKLLDREV